MYYTYMLRCADGSVYTGITTDIERRLGEHASKGEKCAKYTRNHSVVKLEAAWQSENRSLASKLEYSIKTLSKAQKEQLIKSKRLQDFFPEKLDAQSYTTVK